MILSNPQIDGKHFVLEIKSPENFPQPEECTYTEARMKTSRLTDYQQFEKIKKELKS